MSHCYSKLLLQYPSVSPSTTMILRAFPRLKETGMWTRYRVNKRHEGKCYVTFPNYHFNDNVTEIITSQLGFENAKVKVIKDINNVPEKAHKVVAIGVHQTISEDDIKTELANSNIKINKVQRLKFNGQPTRKVVIQFENEQDMKIALFSGIYFGRMRIRCESYRTTPSITQCYKCQGFNHVAKDCKKDQKCVQSDLTQKLQNNKRETEQELDKVVQKLETTLENSFKELSEKIVSFMVNSMLQMYEKLDRKNADKVYDILSKESVEHFNFRLDPVSPPLSPSTSVETSVTPVDNSKNQNKAKKLNTQGSSNKQAHPPRQLPIVQKIVAPRSRKLQNGNKK